MKTLLWNKLSQEEQTQALARPLNTSGGKPVYELIQNICEDIKTNGPDAVLAYCKTFDHTQANSLSELIVTAEQRDKADQALAPDLITAIQRAYDNIYSFHKEQGLKNIDVTSQEGIERKRIIQAIDSVGLYIPGGSAPLFSTVLMLGIPSQIAGCRYRTLCTPAKAADDIHPAILYAAKLCGIQDIFAIGGAQAIAAMAYGTPPLRKVSKIYGPGNMYVTAAKSYVDADAQGAALDMPAGPSEVCVIADSTTIASFAASDLLSQAEHDPQSQTILICTDPRKITEIEDEVTSQLTKLERKDIIIQALKHSRAIQCDSLAQAIEISNDYAPEHLILCINNADDYVGSVKNTGSLFVGQYTPESLGDYASGTNHVLPTYGYARSYSGLGVEAFQRSMTVQKANKNSFSDIASTVEIMAQHEGLMAHKAAITLRKETIDDSETT